MRKKHILNTFGRKAEKKWDTLYWAVDIHDTCIKANYKAGNIPTEFFPGAKEALLKIASRPDCCLILFTCSHPHEIDKYLQYFEDHGIKFKHVNKNPEAANTAFGFFEHKFYTNFILDDKAGFDPTTDWTMIMEALEEVEYIESTTPEERAKHKKEAYRLPAYTGIGLALSIAVGGLLGYAANALFGNAIIAALISIVFISSMFGVVTVLFHKKSISSPYKFHLAK